MKKTWLLIIFSWLILPGFIFLQRPDDKLHLIFCDVGQGDAILAVWQNNQILIDGGPDNSVLTCLANHLPFWERKLEAVILTHSDADHAAGLEEVKKRYQINEFIDETKVKQGDKIKLGNMVLEVLWPKFLEGDTNERSVVTRLSFGNFDALLTADLPALTSQILFWRRQLPLVEVLKASHHGSKTDNPDELYQGTNPKAVIFSVGENKFGHPDEDLVRRLTEQGITVKRTDQEGEIEIVSDGENWWFRKSAADH